MHGERVKEFVCDEHGEAVVALGNLVKGVVPGERNATVFAEGGSLEGAHCRACLDKVHAVEVGAYGWELADDLCAGAWVSVSGRGEGDVRVGCRP